MKYPRTSKAFLWLGEWRRAIVTVKGVSSDDGLTFTQPDGDCLGCPSGEMTLSEKRVARERQRTQKRRAKTNFDECIAKKRMGQFLLQSKTQWYEVSGHSMKRTNEKLDLMFRSKSLLTKSGCGKSM